MMNVQLTTNYDQFTYLKGNRKINEIHVLKLMDSMQNEQLVTPILVNERMEIIDGQHRFEAEKRLGLPVYYLQLEGYGLKECHMLNVVTQRYKPEDFLEGYVALEMEQYVKFKQFRTKYKFLSIHLCQIYLTGGIRRDKQETFKQGLFEIKNYDQACEWAERSYDFKPYTGRFFTNRNFHTSLLKFYRHPNYDHEKMLQKMEFKSGELKHHAKERYFVENLCNIYNYKTRDEERIYPHELTKI